MTEEKKVFLKKFVEMLDKEKESTKDLYKDKTILHLLDEWGKTFSNEDLKEIEELCSLFISAYIAPKVDSFEKYDIYTDVCTEPSPIMRDRLAFKPAGFCAPSYGRVTFGSEIELLNQRIYIFTGRGHKGYGVFHRAYKLLEILLTLGHEHAHAFQNLYSDYVRLGNVSEQNKQDFVAILGQATEKFQRRVYEFTSPPDNITFSEDVLNAFKGIEKKIISEANKKHVTLSTPMSEQIMKILYLNKISERNAEQVGLQLLQEAVSDFLSLNTEYNEEILAVLTKICSSYDLEMQKVDLIGVLKHDLDNLSKTCFKRAKQLQIFSEMNKGQKVIIDLMQKESILRSTLNLYLLKFAQNENVPLEKVIREIRLTFLEYGYSQAEQLVSQLGLGWNLFTETGAVDIPRKIDGDRVNESYDKFKLDYFKLLTEKDVTHNSFNAIYIFGEEDIKKLIDFNMLHGRMIFVGEIFKHSDKDIYEVIKSSLESEEQGNKDDSVFEMLNKKLEELKILQKKGNCTYEEISEFIQMMDMINSSIKFDGKPNTFKTHYFTFDQICSVYEKIKYLCDQAEILGISEASKILGTKLNYEEYRNLSDEQKDKLFIDRELSSKRIKKVYGMKEYYLLMEELKARKNAEELLNKSEEERSLFGN